jgi:hypothetical protein
MSAVGYLARVSPGPNVLSPPIFWIRKFRRWVVSYWVEDLTVLVLEDRLMLYIIFLSFFFIFLKLMWLLKLLLHQNLIMIYHKFNSDFKSHVNFMRIKGRQEDDMYHYSRGWQKLVILLFAFFLRVITFFSHQLPIIINMPPWTDTSTKREHPTTNFTHFAPFRQFNS